MKECLTQAFEKLTIRQQRINRDCVKLAILYMLKLSISKSIKMILRKMNRYLNEYSGESTFERSQFRVFII